MGLTSDMGGVVGAPKPHLAWNVSCYTFHQDRDLIAVGCDTAGYPNPTPMVWGTR